MISNSESDLESYLKVCYNTIKFLAEEEGQILIYKEFENVDIKEFNEFIRIRWKEKVEKDVRVKIQRYHSEIAERLIEIAQESLKEILNDFILLHKDGNM